MLYPAHSMPHHAVPPVAGEFVIGRSFAGDSVILKHCAVMMKTIDAYESPLVSFIYPQSGC